MKQGRPPGSSKLVQYLTHRWNPEDYAGAGPAAQPVCIVRYCGNKTESRGLCFACYMAWRRHGMEGFEARVLRVAHGENIHVRSVEAGMAMLVDTYEDWTATADSDDTELYDVLRKRVVSICHLVGMSEHRRRSLVSVKKYRQTPKGRACWQRHEAKERLRAQAQRLVLLPADGGLGGGAAAAGGASAEGGVREDSDRADRAS